MAGCSSESKTAPQNESTLQPTQADAEKVAQQVSLLWNRQDFAALYNFFIPELREQRSKSLFVKYALMEQADSPKEDFNLIYEKTVMGLESNTAFAYYTGSAGLLEKSTPAFEMRYNGTMWLLNAFAGYFSDSCPSGFCNDDDPCTVDACDESLECVNSEVKAENRNEDCLLRIGVRNSDKLTCAKIADNATRWTCYHFVAKQTGEVELCDQMPDWSKKRCTNAVKQSCQEGLFKNCCGNEICEAGERGKNCSSDCFYDREFYISGTGRTPDLSGKQYEIKLVDIIKEDRGKFDFVTNVTISIDDNQFKMGLDWKPIRYENLEFSYSGFKSPNEIYLTVEEIGS